MPDRFTKREVAPMHSTPKRQTLTSDQYLYRRREPKVKAKRDHEKHSGLWRIWALRKSKENGVSELAIRLLLMLRLVMVDMVHKN